ncbi:MULTISPECIES: DUF6755 family protein [unclassified Apibacter]|uniref:DUF6755 family protein n=1 Tax=unclassified Apibacter TaxID=2630820 RepID=UPI00135D746B|nr:MULTISPECIES: DUF6755 family protein [unclassified Apibacter]MXP05539.1 hypothetical protein [Apibacter sp. B3546]MXP12504.1 hypothetical protein [Apibacter sp. B3239]
MNNFKEVQNSANSNKINTLMSAIIVILILILTLQVWMMYGALNNALDDNQAFAWATFGGSVFLFISAVFLLRYLPEPPKNLKKDPNNKYE